MRLSASERRQAIVTAAVRLFSEKGFRGTTTRELAAAVGVTEPVIYQHFKTKRDLYEAITETKALAVAEELERWPQRCKDGDDREAFLGLARMIWRWYEEDRELARLLLFSALEGNELAGLFFTRHAEGFLRQVSNLIRRRVRAGAFRGVNADTSAWLFIGMVAHHAESVALFGFDPMPRDREEVLAETVDVFLRGVLQNEDKIAVANAGRGAGSRVRVRKESGAKNGQSGRKRVESSRSATRGARNRANQKD